jgi:hypothetical protein
VVADVQSGSGTAKPGEQPALRATPTPTPSITAVPDHTAPETQRIQVELQTHPPLQPTHSPTHGVGDDKGGLRPDGVSDDGPLHDLGDDKGGLRDGSESDDGPGDDRGGDR